MYRKILIPLDGSQRAEHIFRHLETLFDLKDAQFTLVSVVEVSDTHGPDVKERIALARSEAERYLKSVARRLRDAGRQADIDVRTARRPEHGILALEEARDFDLLAITSHGYSGLDRLHYGSTTERVLRAASTPILLLRSRQTWDQRGDDYKPIVLTPSRVRSVLAPLDGSKSAEIVLGDAARVARHHGVPLHLLRVVPVVPRSGFYVAEGLVAVDSTAEMARFHTLAGELRQGGCDVRVAIRHGTTIDGITRYVAEHDVGLIAMTTHGRSGFSRFLLGSVAEGLLRTIHTPILLRRVAT